MKQYNFIKTILLTSLAILATSCGENAMDEMTIDDTPKTYTLIFNAQKPSFESEEGGTTRAKGTSWEDGDVIYMVATNGSERCRAHYYNGQWSIEEQHDFEPTPEKDCKVYYFKGETTIKYSSETKQNSTISFNDKERTPLFHSSKSFKSTFRVSSNNEITITAKLEPKAFRFCFKNNTGAPVSFEFDSDNQIDYYESYDWDLKQFQYGPKKISGSANNGKPSDYYYGTYIKNAPSTINLTLTIDGTQYTRTLSTSQLVAGEGDKNSGYFNLPTSSNLNGWTKIQKGPDFNGHDAVDLGLKDDQGRTIYWATCNIDASKPEDYGLYFAWGEIKGYAQNEYHDFSWGNYIWCNGDGYSMTKYCTDSNYGTVDDKTTLSPSDDAAHVNWGGDWRMPTYKELEQLRDKCTWSYEDTKATVTGPSKESIILPAAGVIPSKSNSYGSDGLYWSSSIIGNPDGAYGLTFSTKKQSHGWGNFIRYQGLSIRAVCVPTN